jgi:nucleotide-binding universal stress UspA family protein
MAEWLSTFTSSSSIAVDGHCSYNGLAQELHQRSIEHPDSMVVMSSQGASGWTEVMLGSNAVSVLHASRQPVLVVPSKSHWPESEPIKWVFASDMLDDRNPKAITWIKSFIAQSGAELSIAHVEEGTKGDAPAEGFLAFADQHFSGTDRHLVVAQDVESGIYEAARRAKAHGIIVVAPTRHQKTDEGGQYEWVRTGILPYLPSEISRLLPDNSTAALASVDLKGVETFLSQHMRSECPELLDARIAEANRKLSLGSRHDNTRNLLLFCLREAMAGLYPAQECVEAVARIFILHKPTNEWTSPSEFIGMVRWAVAQAQDTSQEELTAIRGGVLLGSSPAAISWLRSIA